METRRAHPARVESVPLVPAGARPAVFLAWRPPAKRAPDAWGTGVLLVLKLAVWNDDRIVRDGTHARYYDLRPYYLGSVRQVNIEGGVLLRLALLPDLADENAKL